MKKIFFSALLLSGFALTSCDNLLEVEQKSTSSTESFYKTDADAESAVTAMYATYIGEIAGTEGIWNAYIMGLNYSADDVFAAGGDINDHADFRILNEMRYNASSGPISTLYNHIYKSIYSANLVINYFDKEGATDYQKQAVAEARVMRAWAHMLAAQVYDTPPIVDHLLLNEKPVNAESAKAIYEFCIKDCEDAAKILPERKGKDDKEGAYRVTKGFAQFVGGKAALFAGNNAKAKEFLKPLCESTKYGLVPGNRFRDLFHVEGDGCEEKIFEFNFSTNMAMGEWGGNIQRGRWMVANVLNWRGDDIVGGGENPLICSCGGWGGGSINHEFAHKMLANEGDSYRRKATFLTSDEFFYDESLCGWKTDVDCPTLEAKQFDPGRGINKPSGSFSRSDVMEVKMMMHPNDRGYSNSNNNTNFCIARLGEAYLLYAEALINLNETSEAKIWLNKIQKRAGAPEKEATLQNLQDEKQYELWFEGCRWFDIVRWGIAQQCYDKVLDNIPYQFDEYFTSGGTKPHKLTYVVNHPFKEANITLKFEKKNEHWPIPQSVLEVNDQMHQTDAWK